MKIRKPKQYLKYCVLQLTYITKGTTIQIEYLDTIFGLHQIMESSIKRGLIRSSNKTSFPEKYFCIKVNFNKNYKNKFLVFHNTNNLFAVYLNTNLIINSILKKIK